MGGARSQVCPPPNEDLDGWIEGPRRQIHTRNAEILGDAFWDIHAPRHNPSEALAEMDAFRREYRIRGVQAPRGRGLEDRRRVG